MAGPVSNSPDTPPGRWVAPRSGPIIELVPAGDSRALVTLLYRSAAADAAAFAELYDLTVSRVYGLALRVLRSPRDAEDVAMDSYLEVWRNSARFDPRRCDAMAWMLAIVLARVADKLVDPKDALRPRTQSPPVVAGPRAAPTPEQIAQMTEALTRLRPAQREVLERACRESDDTDADALVSILSTLVHASVWAGLRRNDGTTYGG